MNNLAACGIILLVASGVFGAFWLSKMKLASIVVGLVGYLGASIPPLIILGIAFAYTGASQSEILRFSHENSLYIVTLAAFIEEISKLWALWLLQRRYKDSVDFFTRLFSGFSFGIWEFLTKLVSITIYSNPKSTEEITVYSLLALAALTIGLHGLVFMYPNTIRSWLIAITLLALTFYHTMQNLLIKSISSNASFDFELAYAVLSVPWMLLALVVMSKILGKRFWPLAWN